MAKITRRSIDPFGVVPDDLVLEFSPSERKALKRARTIIELARGTCERRIGFADWVDSDMDYLLAFGEHGIGDLLDDPIVVGAASQIASRSGE